MRKPLLFALIKAGYLVLLPFLIIISCDDNTEIQPDQVIEELENPSEEKMIFSEEEVLVRLCYQNLLNFLGPNHTGTGCSLCGESGECEEQEALPGDTLTFAGVLYAYDLDIRSSFDPYYAKWELEGDGASILGADTLHTVKVYFDSLFSEVRLKCTLSATNGEKCTLYVDIGTPLQIGDVGPAGGIIFYDKGVYSDGWRYMEAAPYDIGQGFEWGCFNKPIPSSRERDIGFGLFNSNEISDFHNAYEDYFNNPEQCSDVSDGTVAAVACLSRQIGEFDNWHLPSADESYLMYENLHLNGYGNFDTSALYWTSTEHDDNTAVATDFSTGNQGFNCKQCAFGQTLIRAARYF